MDAKPYCRIVLYVILFFLFFTLNLGAQSTDQNFILSRTYKTRQTSLAANVKEASQHLQYLDGLGRPLQSISIQASPLMGSSAPQDIITHIEYDSLGRVSKSYLPYPAYGNGSYQSGAADAANAFYNSSNFNYPNTRGFTQTKYEASSLNRPLKQYAGGSSTPVEIRYQTNAADEVNFYTVSLSSTENTPPSLGQSQTYPANTLSYTETKDEDGNRAREYKDKAGRVILKRVYANETLDTYYVYNSLGQLSFVLQPQYQVTQDVNLFAFRYTYNKKGLLSKKLIPGGGETSLTYNERDLLATSTDARGRTTYYTYDGLNRPLETGEVIGSTRVALTRTRYDGYPNYLKPDSLEQYRQPSFESYAGSSATESTQGLVTVTATRILQADSNQPNNKWYFTTHYYNDRQQLIETIRDLYDFSGNAKEIHARQLRFDGHVLAELVKQNLPSGIHSVEKFYSYDQADRQLSTRYVVKKGDVLQKDVTLAAHRYDGIGQLQQTFLHSVNATQFREQLDYKYTPRAFLSTILGKTSGGDNFGIDLRYDQVSSDATALKNGNIAQLLWKKNANDWTGFNYTYDGANRLKTAVGVGASGSIKAYTYRETISSYDRNGNINGLSRWGEGSQWDDLTYTYTGNRLSKVSDATTGSDKAKGFDNGTTVNNTDYSYDAAGNLIQDTNRGIAAEGIKYNLLNLIGSIQLDSLITYDYDASGTKVRMTRGGVYHTRYAGLFEYDENNFLTRIATEEGQIRVSNGGNNYAVEYYLKDHLGNVRVVLDENGNKVQETEYFAFGLAIPKTIGSNKYLYNGKELQPKTGFLDYGWRQYDAAIGRWMSVDPLTDKQESYSPYHYVYDNPIRNTDPDGREPCCGDFLAFGKGVGIGLYDGLKGTVVGLYNTVAHPIQTAQGIGSAIYNYKETATAIKNAAVGTYNKAVYGSPQEKGEVVGQGLALVAEAVVGTKGATKAGSVSKVAQVAEAAEVVSSTTKIAGKVGISPNVQKVLNTIADLKKEGGGVQVNKLKAVDLQELNMTFQNIDGSKLDLRIETHGLPTHIGGQGTEIPIRHLNADVYNSSGNRVKMRHINGGHKILE